MASSRKRREQLPPGLDGSPHMMPDFGFDRNRQTGPPEIKPTEIERMFVIGDGSFGTVFKGKCRGQHVAIKVLHKQDLDERTLSTFRKEVEIMSKIFHPNIVLFMGACTEPGHMMIVTEYLSKGDLENMLRDEKISLTLATRLKWIKETIQGMTWLHCSNPPIIHRDLKTSNLLIDNDYHIKICDFGLAQIKSSEFLKDGVEGAKGTPLWMSPEVLAGNPFNEKADVYSFGIVLWEIYTRQEPFKEFENFEDFRMAICEQRVRPLLPNDCPSPYQKMVDLCLNHDPSSRPSFSVLGRNIDIITIECLIPDHFGAELWKKYFKEKDMVPWNDFAAAFVESMQAVRLRTRDFQLPAQPTPTQLRAASEYQLREFANRNLANQETVMRELDYRAQNPNWPTRDDYNIEEIHFKCLKAVIAEKPKNSEGVVLFNQDDTVATEQFGKVLAWFGPVCNSFGQPIMLQTITGLLRKPWFHGRLDTREAESRLNMANANGPKVGTFLVRFSSTNMGYYTISKISANGINHQRVVHHTGHGFYINNRKYSTLQEMIEIAHEELQLKFPCPGSPYLSLFTEQTIITGYIQGNVQLAGLGRFTH